MGGPACALLPSMEDVALGGLALAWLRTVGQAPSGVQHGTCGGGAGGPVCGCLLCVWYICHGGVWCHSLVLEQSGGARLLKHCSICASVFTSCPPVELQAGLGSWGQGVTGWCGIRSPARRGFSEQHL